MRLLLLLLLFSVGAQSFSLQELLAASSVTLKKPGASGNVGVHGQVLMPQRTATGGQPRSIKKDTLYITLADSGRGQRTRSPQGDVLKRGDGVHIVKIVGPANGMFENKAVNEKDEVNVMLFDPMSDNSSQIIVERPNHQVNVETEEVVTEHEEYGNVNEEEEGEFEDDPDYDEDMESASEGIEENKDTVSTKVPLDNIGQKDNLDLESILDNIFADSDVAKNEVRSILKVDDQSRHNAFIDELLERISIKAKDTLEPLDIDLQENSSKNKKNKQQRKKKNKNKSRSPMTIKEDSNKNSDVPDILDEHHSRRRDAASKILTEDGNKSSNGKKSKSKEINSKVNMAKDVRNKSSGKEEKVRNKQKRKRNKRKNKNNKNEKKMGSSVVHLQGISNLQRLGDVKVAELKQGRGLKTEFTIDPVNLEVKRKNGAQTQPSFMSRMKLWGKMLVFVSNDGTPTIRNLVLRNRPQNFMNIGRRKRPGMRTVEAPEVEQYVNLVTPVAARRLSTVATEILNLTKPN